MFVDDVTITAVGGNGGNGAVAFRREKHVPLGGPAGGDGGKGGSIIFVGDEGMTTLLNFRYQRIIKAKNGENGMAKNMFGRAADDVYIRVPIGTTVYDTENNIIIADITKHNQEAVIASGGRGGRGNSTFATSRVPAPEYSEKGEKGDTKELRLELKILADVGLVGFPSVGKSTIISVISAAKPKIADYPFTTLSPNLGVASVGDGRSFIVADMPGLIEGASLGAGLGHQFLKHIERTRVIVHVVDMASMDERDPYEDYIKINNELMQFNPKLLQRPQIVVANKMDIPEAKENLEKFMEKCKNVDIIPISAYTRDNLSTLLYKIADTLESISLTEFEEDFTEEVVEYKFVPEDEEFTITLGEDDIYEIYGKGIQKVFEQTDFNRDENAKLFARKVRGMGVDEELRKLGVKHGDTVRILGYDFEFLD